MYTYYVPEIENSILSILPSTLLVHFTVEASTAVIRNVDSSTSTPLTLVVFVTVAVAVTFPSITLVSTAPSPSAVDD
jgi:hypothetical protein